MAHLPEEELADWLDQAKNQVSIGGLYIHYKAPGKQYKVLDLGILEFSDEPVVIYQAQYGQQLTYVRTLKSWIEKVEFGGGNVSRYSPVNSPQEG